MKKYLMILISIFFFNCNKDQSITKIELTKNVNQFLNNWHKNAKNANFENYFKAFDEQSVFIGTDATENWTKKEFQKYCKPYFDKKTTWNFKTLERNIYSNKDQSIIWFDELINSWMGICRGSGVIENNKNEFKIKQYIVSATIPNDIIKNVHDIKKTTDSLLIKTNFK